MLSRSRRKSSGLTNLGESDSFTGDAELDAEKSPKLHDLNELELKLLDTLLAGDRKEAK